MRPQANEARAAWSSRASLPAHGQALEPVKQGEGLLDNVAELAQALDVHGARTGDHWQDPAALQTGFPPLTWPVSATATRRLPNWC